METTFKRPLKRRVDTDQGDGFLVSKANGKTVVDFFGKEESFPSDEVFLLPVRFQDQLESKENDNATLDMKGLTFSEKGGDLLFLTNVFKDGTLLGFWTHSPCGRCADQERGWSTVNPETMEVMDSCTVVSGGVPAGEDFVDWRRSAGLEHGKSQFLTDEFGDRTWKMSDE